jgi:hypothetical protein
MDDNISFAASRINFLSTRASEAGVEGDKIRHFLKRRTQSQFRFELPLLDTHKFIEYVEKTWKESADESEGYDSHTDYYDRMRQGNIEFLKTLDVEKLRNSAFLNGYTLTELIHFCKRVDLPPSGPKAKQVRRLLNRMNVYELI